MDDDSFVSQFRNNNQKLVEWLKPKHFIRLVDHVLLNVIVEDKKAGKYPMVAADLLSSDIPTIARIFFPIK